MYTLAGFVVLAVLLVQAAVWASMKIYALYRHRLHFSRLPGPPYSMLWGHLKVVGEVSKKFPPNTHPQWYFTELARKYNLKGVYYIDLAPASFVFICLTDPDVMDQAFVKRALPQHQETNDMLTPMVGPDVIAAANGPVWKALHRAIMPAFSPSHLRSLTDLMIDEILIFRDHLDKLVLSQEVFSVEQLGGKLVFDIIARAIYNFRLHAQTKGSQEYEDLHEMVRLANIRLATLNPYVKIKTSIQLWSVARRSDAVIRAQILERYDLLRKNQVIPSRKNPLSILDLMLRDKLEQARLEGEKGASPGISTAEMKLIVTNIKGLLLGGHGTSTDSLVFTYTLLSKNPKVLQKLRDEHTAVFSPDTDRTMQQVRENPQMIDELHYTNAVISETLRMFSVGFGVREAPKGTTVTFEGNEYPIHGGGICQVGHDLHWNPEFFPEPNKFEPDRFLGEDAERSRNCMRSFSRGIRACSGQGMARMEMKLILLLTVRDYDFECSGLKPAAEPLTAYTNLDTVYGDIIFQELALEARPRGGGMMTVRKAARAAA